MVYKKGSNLFSERKWNNCVGQIFKDPRIFSTRILLAGAHISRQLYITNSSVKYPDLDPKNGGNSSHIS